MWVADEQRLGFTEINFWRSYVITAWICWFSALAGSFSPRGLHFADLSISLLCSERFDFLLAAVFLSLFKMSFICRCMFRGLPAVYDHCVSFSSASREALRWTIFSMQATGHVLLGSSWYIEQLLEDEEQTEKSLALPQESRIRQLQSMLLGKISN